MSAVLTKTRPGAEMRMGALLRDALAFQGISVRVDQPCDLIPSEYLIAEREGRTRVWIHAVSCNGEHHYDVTRAELMAVAAIVTDDQGTRFVYDGFSDDAARPVAQAVAMAAAVARHFGLPVREYDDAFAGVRHSNGTRDKRYTVAREYCGYETPRMVARFCGHWISSHETTAAAWAAARRHKNGGASA